MIVVEKCKKELQRNIERDTNLSMSLPLILFSLYVSTYFFVENKISVFYIFLIVVICVSFSLGVFLLIRFFIYRMKYESVLPKKIKAFSFLNNGLFLACHILLFLFFTVNPYWLDVQYQNTIFNYSYSFVSDLFFAIHFLYAVIFRFYLYSTISKKMSGDVYSNVKSFMEINKRKKQNNFKFGNKLCALRESLKISQKDVANKLGVSIKTISKWENGSCYPNQKHFKTLSNLYKQDLYLVLEEYQ